MANSNVTLDVGGVHYRSAYSTLASVPGSKLATYLHRWTEDGQEDIFIDRDGKHFRYILNFLRDQTKVALPGDVDVLGEIKREAQFYQLPAFCSLLDMKINKQLHEQMISSPNYVYVDLKVGDKFSLLSNQLSSKPCPCSTPETKVTKGMCAKGLMDVLDHTRINGVVVDQMCIIKEYATCFDVVTVGNQPDVKYHIWKKAAAEYEFKVIKKEKGERYY